MRILYNTSLLTSFSKSTNKWCTVPLYSHLPQYLTYVEYSINSWSSFSTPLPLRALEGLPRRGSHYFLESLYTPGRWLAKRWRPLNSGNWTPNIYIPSGARVAQLYPQALGAHFSHLLRHVWVTLGLFFTPGYHMGAIIDLLCQNPHWWSPVILPTYGINFQAKILDKILYTVGSSYMSLNYESVLSPFL
jgi:hypothetical protein